MTSHTFARALMTAKQISDGAMIRPVRDDERILARAVLGLQARVEQLEEQNDSFREADSLLAEIVDTYGEVPRHNCGYQQGEGTYCRFHERIADWFVSRP